MSHRYPNSPSTEYSRSVATVTYAYSVMGILRGDKQKRNRSHRKSNCKNLKSYGWSSEPNRSQCKLRVQKINSLVFFCYLNFFFRSSYPFFLFYVTTTTFRRIWTHIDMCRWLQNMNDAWVITRLLLEPSALIKLYTPPELYTLLSALVFGYLV